MKNLEPYTDPLFKVVKLEGKKDNPPEYLRSITLQGIAAYYFNWHSDETHATWEVIKAWYAKARGWSWEAL